MDVKSIARTAALGAIFLIPFLPLYVSHSLFFPFITGKGFAFRVLVEIVFAAWVVLAIADVRYRPRFSWPLVFFGALVVWMAIADIFGVNPHKAFWSNYERMDGWVTLVHLFMLFVAAGSLLATEKLMGRWWRFFLAGAALVVGYALLQMASLVTINQGGVRVDSTFGNAAYLAAYLLFVIPLALWQARKVRSRGWQYALIALAALSSVVLFYTATRGALIGFAVAALAGLALYACIGSGRARRVSLIALITLGVCIGGFIAVRDAAWIQGTPTLGRLASISLHDLAVRADIWSMALKGFAERPVLGWGQEGFNQVFNTYYEPALYAQEPWFDRAHNIYLDWLIAGGLPALALFLALIGAVAWTFFRRGETPAERALLIAALIAYGVQGLVVFDNLFTYVPLVLLAGFAHMRHSRTFEALERLPVPPASTLSAVVAPVLLVAALGTIYMVNVPGYAAAKDVVIAMGQSDPARGMVAFEKALGHGSFASQEIREQLSMAATRAAASTAPAAVREQFLMLAVNELSSEIARVPRDARLYVLLAQPYRAGGLIDEAIAAIREAKRLSPKKQALYLEEGIILLGAGRALEAREVWKTAYEFDTSFDPVRVYAAAGEIAAGNTARGKEILIERFGTHIVDSEVLSYAYYTSRNFADLALLWEMRVEADPKNAEKQFGLATAYALAGRTRDARLTAEAIAREFPEEAARVRAFIDALAAGKIS